MNFHWKILRGRNRRETRCEKSGDRRGLRPVGVTEHSKMKENGYKFETIASFTADSKISLTLKEEIGMNLAMDLGYFDVPRRIEIDELSKIIGCSKSTLSVRLRCAEKKVLDFYRLLSIGRNITGK